jgi:hypothetical protein
MKPLKVMAIRAWSCGIRRWVQLSLVASVALFRVGTIAGVWDQVICASTACTKSLSGRASAKARLYFKFRREELLDRWTSGTQRWDTLSAHLGYEIHLLT